MRTSPGGRQCVPRRCRRARRNPPDRPVRGRVSGATRPNVTDFTFFLVFRTSGISTLAAGAVEPLLRCGSGRPSGDCRGRVLPYAWTVDQRLARKFQDRPSPSVCVSDVRRDPCVVRDLVAAQPRSSVRSAPRRGDFHSAPKVSGTASEEPTFVNASRHHRARRSPLPAAPSVRAAPVPEVSEPPRTSRHKGHRCEVVEEGRYIPLTCA
jgi:hypothetical protein